MNIQLVPFGEEIEVAKQARRDSNLTPDSRGRYRCRIGQLADGKSPVFLLGTDKREALIRRGRIADLWDLSVVSKGGHCWQDWSLSAARALASGQIYEHPRVSHYSERAYAQDLNFVRTRYPDAEPADPAAYAKGLSENQQWAKTFIAQAVEDRVNLVLADLRARGIVPAETTPEDVTGQTLHDLLRAYRSHLESQDAAASTLAAWVGDTNRLIEFHPDLPLSKLDYHGVQGLIDLWRSRPSRDDRRLTANTCRNHIKRLVAALRWAHRSSEIQWAAPADFTEFKRTVKVLPSELQKLKTADSVPVYTVDQLRKLYAIADDLDRLLILLGINCGFGAAEAGRLSASDCHILEAHPRQNSITGFNFQRGQSFVSYIRPKSGVIGDWLLWDETTKYLSQQIDRAKSLGTDRIICRGNGNPLYSETSKNGQAAFANRWSALHKRLDDATVPKLPYGSLRDLACTTMRDHHGPELASLVIQHGSPVEDSLLKYYSTAPVGKLFAALADLETVYAPIWS